MRRVPGTRKYRKVWIILIVCFCISPLLPAVIVMETPQTEVTLLVIDRVEERNRLPSSSLVVPLCSLVIAAKHEGRGYLEIYHTPLVNEFERVSYTLLCDNLERLPPDGLSYGWRASIRLVIPLIEISAEFSKVLQGDRSSYSSEVFLHLKLDT